MLTRYFENTGEVFWKCFADTDSVTHVHKASPACQCQLVKYTNPGRTGTHGWMPEEPDVRGGLWCPLKERAVNRAATALKQENP